MVKMLDDMAAGPSPAECSRIDPKPPSSPAMICVRGIQLVHYTEAEYASDVQYYHRLA